MLNNGTLPNWHATCSAQRTVCNKEAMLPQGTRGAEAILFGFQFANGIH